MQSKVIIFCVLLFCSKIVDSIPHSEGLRRQRVTNLPSTWQVNQNVQDTQYLNPLPNSANQQENNQDYYSNQQIYNYNGYGYNKGPVSLPSGKKLLDSYNSQANEHRLDSLPGVDTSQVRFDSQQFGNQNWQPQNQYTNENPLVNTEPYRAPVQYDLQNNAPSSNPRLFQHNQPYLTRQKFKYPSVDNAGDNKYVANAAPHFGPNGFVLYENDGESQARASVIKKRLTGGHRYLQHLAPQSENIYEVPAETLKDQSELIKNVEKYRSPSDSSNTAPTANYDGDSAVVSVADNYSSGSGRSNDPYNSYGDVQAASEEKSILNGGRRFFPKLAPQFIKYKDFSAVPATDVLEDQFQNTRNDNTRNDNKYNYKLRSDSSSITNQDYSLPVIFAADNTDSDYKRSYAPENIEKKAPVDISNFVPDKYAHPRNYRSETELSDTARDNSFNGAPTVISQTVEEKSGQYEVNYETNEPKLINTISRSSPTSTDTALTKRKTNKNEEIKNDNLEDTIKKFNISEFVSKKVQKEFLDGTKKYLVIHPNGTVEYVNSIDLDSHHSKLRLVNTKRKNVGDAERDGTQSPENVPNNSVKTSVPVNESSLPADNQPVDDKKSTPLNVDESNLKLAIKDLPADHSNFKTTHAKQKPDGDNLKPLPPLVYQPAVNPPGDDGKKQLRPYIQQSGDDKDQPLSPYKRWLAQYLNSKQPIYDSHYNPSSNENQPLDANNFKTLPSNKNHQSRQSHLYQPQDVNNVSSSSPSKNKPADYKDVKPLPSHEKWSEDNSKVNLPSLDEKQPEYDTTSNSWSPDRDTDDNPEYNNTLKPNSSHGSNQYKNAPKVKPGDNNTSYSSSSNDNQSVNDDTSPQNKQENDNNSNLSSAGKNGTEDVNASPNKPKPSNHSRSKLYEDQSENDDTFPENKPGDNKKYKHSKSSNLNGSEDDETPRRIGTDDKDYNSWSSDRETDDNPEYNNTLKPFNHNKLNSSHGSNQSKNHNNAPKVKPGDNNTFYSSSSNDNQSVNDDTSPQNIQENDNNSNLSAASKNETEDVNASPNKAKPSNHSNPKSYEDQSENDDTFPENKPGDNKKYKHSKSSNRNRSEDDNTPRRIGTDDKDYNSSSSSENQSEDDNKPEQPTNILKTTPSVIKTDYQLDSTTLSLTAPNYTTSSKPQVTTKKYRQRHIHPKSTTSSPIVSSTTPCPEETSENQIITLSPIEQVTENVSNVPSVTTTTTIAKPTETPGTSDTIKNANNKKKNSAKLSSGNLASITDKVLTSTPTNKIKDNKTTKETVEDKNTQTNDKPVKNQVNNVKNDTHTVQSAVLNSSELLDTNTDVPADSDDNSPVTTSPSAHYDVNTGDASGDNTLDLEQPETDVTITVSSSSDNNDSEDNIIKINIEVSESTGSSSKNKTLLVSIDTNNDSEADSKTPQLSGVGGHSPDCNKDHNDDGRGKNLEIDMSNLQGEPTIWIRTTNQDFIDKLTDKNDTAFDVVYYFNMVTQPAIEREKVTTIHCNGTVVIEMKETTYANKDDPTPTVVKTTHTIQVQDYLLYGSDLSND